MTSTCLHSTSSTSVASQCSKLSPHRRVFVFRSFGILLTVTSTNGNFSLSTRTETIKPKQKTRKYAEHFSVGAHTIFYSIPIFMSASTSKPAQAAIRRQNLRRSHCSVRFLKMRRAISAQQHHT